MCPQKSAGFPLSLTVKKTGCLTVSATEVFSNGFVYMGLAQMNFPAPYQNMMITQ
jgi:hypothetical protein